MLFHLWRYLVYRKKKFLLKKKFISILIANIYLILCIPNYLLKKATNSISLTNETCYKGKEKNLRNNKWTRHFKCKQYHLKICALITMHLWLGIISCRLCNCLLFDGFSFWFRALITLHDLKSKCVWFMSCEDKYDHSVFVISCQIPSNHNACFYYM